MNEGNLIFFVDDEPMFINLLEYTFKCKEGYSTESFSSGEACVEKLDENPDLVVVDYFMELGKMTGLELVKLIKEHNAATPIIMLSGNSDSEAIEESKAAGVADYIIKDGYFIDNLTEKISEILGR